MEVTRSTVAILAAACITAGATGTYLATRPDVSAAAAGPALDTTIALDADAGVEASEGVIGEAPVPVPVEAAAPAPERPAVRPTRPRVAASPAPQPTPLAATPTIPAVTAPAAPAPAPGPLDVTPPVPPVAPARAMVEPVRPEEPPAPAFHELVLSGDSVIGLQVESPISSDTAAVEDAVVARVVRDVKVGDNVAIPAGAKARGEVTLVDKGGKVRGRSRIGVRFTSIVLADGSTVPITTETIYREGDAPGRESTAKIGGGAIGGAIIGGILGGARGAAIGGGIGAGAGSAAVIAGGRNPAILSTGSPVTIRLQAPATVTVAR